MYYVLWLCTNLVHLGQRPGPLLFLEKRKSQKEEMPAEQATPTPTPVPLPCPLAQNLDLPLESEMVWYFTVVYISAWRFKIFLSCRSMYLLKKNLSSLAEKFHISLQPCNILYN